MEGRGGITNTSGHRSNGNMELGVENEAGSKKEKQKVSLAVV